MPRRLRPPLLPLPLLPRPAGKPGAKKEEPPAPAPPPPAEPPLPPFPEVPESDLRSGRMVKLVETQPEPQHEAVEGSAKDLSLAVSAAADVAQVALKTADIVFRSTMMLQTRVHTFAIENTGKVACPSSFHPCTPVRFSFASSRPNVLCFVVAR